MTMQKQTDSNALSASSPAARRAPRHRSGSRWLVHIALLFICSLAIVPFAWMVLTSLKTLEETVAFPPRYWPESMQWRNYLEVFRSPKANFLLWTRNSVLIA